jgi:hypothetical protein
LQETCSGSSFLNGKQGPGRRARPTEAGNSGACRRCRGQAESSGARERSLAPTVVNAPARALHCTYDGAGGHGRCVVFPLAHVVETPGMDPVVRALQGRLARAVDLGVPLLRRAGRAAAVKFAALAHSSNSAWLSNRFTDRVHAKDLRGRRRLVKRLTYVYSISLPRQFDQKIRGNNETTMDCPCTLCCRRGDARMEHGRRCRRS